MPAERTAFKTNLLMLVTACTAAILPAAHAQNQYQGAATVLQKIAAGNGETNQVKSADAQAAAQLQADLDVFKKQNSAQPPATAATGWLALLDRFSRLNTSAPDAEPAVEPRVTFASLMEALPPPAVWDDLARAIDARAPVKGAKAAREIALRIFGHTLIADATARKADMTLLENLLAKSSPEETGQLESMYDQFETVLLKFNTNADATMRSLEHQLANSEYRNQIEIPDLVTLVGPEKTEAFLRKAFKTPNVTIEIERGAATQKLARKLAVEMIAELKSPQWGLANSLDAIELYEALDKQFSKTETPDPDTTTNAAPVVHSRLGMGDFQRTQAQTYYLFALIIKQRTKEAVALAQKLGREQNVYLPVDAMQQLENGGHGEAIVDFFHEMLTQNPALPFWNEYLQMAARNGRAGEALTLMRAASQKTDLSNHARNEIRAHLYQALLAADHVDEGVQEIRQILAQKEEEVDDPSALRFGIGHFELAMMLARIGNLLEHKDWVDEGVQAARAAFEKRPQGISGMYGFNLAAQLAVLLNDLGRGPEAEAVLTEALSRPAADAASARNGYTQRTQRPLISTLTKVYHDSGRETDVLALFDQAPEWGAKDLAEIYLQEDSVREYTGHHVGHEYVLGQFAASALVAAGRKEEARKIIDAILDHDAGFDPAYEILLQLGDTNFTAHMDALFARDPFEERPLIWKAHWLREAGQLEAAETTARQAISIDPSDGEQGPGRRMRAYFELAEIRAARGDTNQAEFFRGAVKAIRMSENADKFYAAGLLSRAVQMYKDSLDHFADAYCIQSRLALRLTEMGMHEEAEAHYRRAYELMPASFGRVESHCFGCEGVFNGVQAQNLAEKVFGELAIKTPDKPQVHYLLGFLREEQGRYNDALPELQKAVKLDPDYLNAWKHIQDIGAESHLAAADRDAVALNLLRLDPLGRHVQANFSEVTDLRSLWTAVEKAAKSAPAKPTALYPLVASAAQLKKATNTNARASRHGFSFDGPGDESDFDENSQTAELLTPAQVIMQHQVIQITIQYLGGNRGYNSFSF